MKKVVITGIGMVNALGSDLASCWQQLLKGRSGIKRLEHLRGNNIEIGGVNTAFSPDTWYATIQKNYSKEGCTLQNAYAFEAVSQALSSAADLAGYGLVTELSSAEPQGPLSALSLLSTSLCASLAQSFSLHHSIECVNSSFGSLNSIAHAYYSILESRAKGMVVVGTTHSVTPLHLKSFSDLGFLNEFSNGTPETAVKPYDQKSLGTALGEGATALLLEDFATARERNAPIYATITGIGRANGAKYTVRPCEEGLGRAVALALARAGARRQTVDLVLAGGCGVHERDSAELSGLLASLTDVKYGMTTATHATGHLLAAQYITSAALAAQSLYTSSVAPMPAPSTEMVVSGEICPFRMIRKARSCPLRSVLVPALGLFGNCSALVLSK